MKNLFILLIIIISSSCNNQPKTAPEKTQDSVLKVEDKNVDNILKNDSMKIKEKEKELLEKYK